MNNIENGETYGTSGRLAGKYAVITGAAGGVGSAACRLFCAEGATVLGVDLNAEAGAALQAQLTSDGFDFQFRALDLTSEADIARFAAEATQERRVDVLYNNAGAILGKHFLESTVEDWDRMHDVNSKSVFLMMREFAPKMTNPGGSIVNTSSAGGAFAIPNMSLYGAAKAGTIMLSRVAAVDLAPGIRVNAIVPGLVDTAMPHGFVEGLPDEHKRAVLDGLARQHLTGRMAQPIEIASAAMFLASDEASFVTASAMYVDGGATAV
jgi:2-keto-3-deoxy-L-fuconate dehydrogenase